MQSPELGGKKTNVFSSLEACMAPSRSVKKELAWKVSWSALALFLYVLLPKNMVSLVIQIYYYYDRERRETAIANTVSIPPAPP